MDLSLVDFTFLTQLLVGVALAICIALFAWRMWVLISLPLPFDWARPKGNARAGVLYAFTLALLPWAKESTRHHWITYMRGVAFHLVIFLGLGLLIISPWFEIIPSIGRTLLAATLALGSLFGLIGFAARFLDSTLRRISTPDDYFAVFLVSLFLASESMALIALPLLPILYLVTAGMLIYMPLGKIRHMFYYAFARLYFGKFVGRRGILPHRTRKAEI